MDHASLTRTHVDVGEVPLHCLTLGDPSAPPVLFLHGGQLTAYTWLAVMQRLSGRYHCIAPDLRGHGDSGWSPDGEYSLAGFAVDVERLAEQLAIGPCLVVGMSLGGQVALRLVADGFPARGLVLVDVGPSYARRSDEIVQGFLGTHRYPNLDAALDAAQSFNPRRDRESLRVSLSRNMVNEPDGSWRWKWDPRRRAGMDSRRAEAETLWTAMAHISCPVMVVRGAESDVFPLEMAQRTVAALPDAHLVTVPAAGHTVQGDNPDALVRALERFFTDAEEETVPR